MNGKHEICNMQILVIAASKEEILPFSTNTAGIDILITGVGVPATMYHIQKRIQQIGYDIIIQAGIAGSFTKNLALGYTGLVKQDCFADIGVVEKETFTPIFETGLSDKNEFPFENGWLINKHKNLLNNHLTSLSAITVNKVSDSDLQKEQFIKTYNADIETMEGAALHYICLQEDIPFLQIRSVSNYVAERDKSKWEIKSAIKNLNKELVTLINNLSDKIIV